MGRFALRAAAASAALLAVTSLGAAETPPPVPGSMDATRVTAGSYAVDPAHTLVGWRVNHFGFNDYFGLFGDVTGTLELDPGKLADAKLDVTIPVSSVLVASSGLKDHLLKPGKDGAAPDFFGPAPKPARFVSTLVRPTGENRALITGLLTLNGVTKPVAIMAEFTGAGTNPMVGKQTIGFKGYGRLNRSEFGIAFGIPLVSDQVNLDITAAFERQ